MLSACDRNRVVVVGSGPAGASAAIALLEQGVGVTLLESGTALPNGLLIRALGRNLVRKWPSNDQQYPFVASGDPATEWPNTLTPGGLSNFWTGAVPRFAPEDFYEGERLHPRYRWPLDYADLAPYYDRAERLLGVVGERREVPQVSPTGSLTTERILPSRWDAIAHFAEQSGHGLMYAPIADGPRWLVRPSGAAFNSYHRLVRQLARFPQFELRLGAHVQRLTFNPALGRVDGVEYVERRTGHSQHMPAAAVVLAAGPLATPKLLLQSTSTAFRDGLGNGAGLVGRYVHDHPKSWRIIEVDRPLPRLDQPLYFSRAPYASTEPLMGASITISPLQKWDRLLSLLSSTTRRFGLVTFATMLPEFDNYVALHPTLRDEFSAPVLDIHMRYKPHVASTVADAYVRLEDTFRRAGYQVTSIETCDSMYPGGSAHYGGGVRMHASPEHGVVDEWNRLHAASNVAVVDASCFTTAVEKNPTLTIMALALRAGQRLATDLATTTSGNRDRSAYALSTIR